MGPISSRHGGAFVTTAGHFLLIAQLATAGLLLLVQVGSSHNLRQQAPQASLRADAGGDARAQILKAYGSRPLAFTLNAGQTDSRVRYYSLRSNYSIYFTPREATYVFRPQTVPEEAHGIGSDRPTRGFALALGFVGANADVRLEGRREGTETVHYFLGNDPARWRTNLSTYEEIVYRQLWLGVDLAFRGEGGRLKYEFLLQPGVPASMVHLAYRGADGLSMDSDGNLLIHTPVGILTDGKPVSYQQIGGRRVPVETRFVLENARRGEYGFEVRSVIDPGYPLVLDPGLAYSTYLGGSDRDTGSSIALDSAGNAYVTGETDSLDFPTTPGAFDVQLNGQDAFVSKLNSSGTVPAYSTFLGGTDADFGFGITVDRSGNVYVAGGTQSGDFPTTVGAFDRTYDGFSGDAFVVKLNPFGAGTEKDPILAYSTYLGGSGIDTAFAIAVDLAGNAYVAGGTNSEGDFPTTVGAWEASYNGAFDAFVSMINPGASGIASLLYSSYLGGTGIDEAFSLALGGAEFFDTGDFFATIYVTGYTESADFDTTSGAYDTTFNGGERDVFVSKLILRKVRLVSDLRYSTFLGGRDLENGRAITLDGFGNAYVTGETRSVDFPSTSGAFDATFNDCDDVFVAKLDVTGKKLLYGTFIGGSGCGAFSPRFEAGYGIAVNSSPAYSIYVTGQTTSPNFPTTSDAFDASHNDQYDAFIVVLNPTATGAAGDPKLVYSTFLGGTVADTGRSIVLDATASFAHVTGFTDGGFPTTAGVYDPAYNGNRDVFVTKQRLIADVVSSNNKTGTLTLNGFRSSSTFGAPLEYVWYEDGVQIAMGQTPTVTLSLGTHTVELIVYEGGTVVDTDSITVCVTAAGRTVDELSAAVNMDNLPDVPPGLLNELQASLDAASASFDRGNMGAGVNQLQAFQNKVRAQGGKKIALSAADTLIAAAQRVISAVIGG